MMLEEFSPTPAQVLIRQTAAQAFDLRTAGRTRFILPDAQRDLGFTWSNEAPTKHQSMNIGECWMESWCRPGKSAEDFFCILAHGEEFMFNMKDGCFYRKVQNDG